jgi:hypothetical protein
LLDAVWNLTTIFGELRRGGTGCAVEIVLISKHFKELRLLYHMILNEVFSRVSILVPWI